MSTVSIRKTHGEDYASIKTVVDQVIADLGGLEDIIKPGYKVIIKPNLVACPTERLSGGVTAGRSVWPSMRLPRPWAACLSSPSPLPPAPTPN